MLVARVHPDEENTLNEPYFLAICAGNGSEALVWRNTKTQEVDGNLFKKNVWLVRLRWLHFCPTAVPPSDLEGLVGARGYRFQPGEAAVVFPASAFIANESSHKAAQTLVKPGLEGQGALRWLPEDAHASLKEDGIELLS